MPKYVVHVRMLIEASSERDAITAASESINLRHARLLDYDFVGDTPPVEVSEHELTQHPAGYLDAAAKRAIRH